MHLFVRHLDALLVLAVHQEGFDLQSGFCRGIADVSEQRLQGTERLARPVQADITEQTVFDGIPLGGTGRIMTYLDLKAEAVANSNLQLLFPKAGSVAIASAAIGENEQAVGIRVVA